jgi:hypothetical protein
MGLRNADPWMAVNSARSYFAGFLRAALTLRRIKGVGRIMSVDNSDVSRSTRFFLFLPVTLSRLESFLVVPASTEADKRGRSISLVTLARAASF